MERKKRSLQDRVDGVYKAGMSRRPKRAVFVIVALASLVESGLQNLNFGDADSVGFFQTRTSSANGLMRHCDHAPAAAVTSSGSTTRVS